MLGLFKSSFHALISNRQFPFFCEIEPKFANEKQFWCLKAKNLLFWGSVSKSKICVRGSSNRDFKPSFRTSSFLFFVKIHQNHQFKSNFEAHWRKIDYFGGPVQKFRCRNFDKKWKILTLNERVLESIFQWFCIFSGIENWKIEGKRRRLNFLKEEKKLVSPGFQQSQPRKLTVTNNKCFLKAANFNNLWLLIKLKN